MYSTAYEALIAQRMSSPLDEQLTRMSKPRRRRALTGTYRPVANRGAQL
ncbi:hypothetical protein [Pseudactinotalea sp.]